jgi:IclR family transcriptional regulator, acetate operon repressor
VSENAVAAGATYQSAERVLALLTSFDGDRVELGVTEMAQSIGVHKSTASRLAAALERAGLLARHGRRYRLGPEVIRLGTLALRSFDMVASVQPAMDKLSQQTGETINLAVPYGTDILNVAEVPSTYILSCSGGWIGRRTKPHAVANGKVLLAYGALDLPRRLERYTDQTITTSEALAAELAAVRRNGYATAVAELEEGLVAVAAPVLDGTGACVAALSISGPATGCDPRRSTLSASSAPRYERALQARTEAGHIEGEGGERAGAPAVHRRRMAPWGRRHGLGDQPLVGREVRLGCRRRCW